MSERTSACIPTPKGAAGLKEQKVIGVPFELMEPLAIVVYHV
jgi:hypothetical protein